MLLTCGLEKILESPWDSKEIKSVNPKGNQSWIFIGRTEADAEAPILWPPDAKIWLIRKDPDVGKIEGRRRRGWQRLRRLDNITDSMDMSLSKLWEMVKEGDKWILKLIWKCKGPRRPHLEKGSQNDRAHTSCFRPHTPCFRFTTRLRWSGLWHWHSERYLDQGNKIESRNKFICIRSIAFWAGYWDYSMGKILVFFIQGITVYSPTKEWIKTPLHTICKN